MPEGLSPAKSVAAKKRVRDENGHFFSPEPVVPPPPPPIVTPKSSNPLSTFFSTNTHYDKNKDDLLDVHVGNPLSRITKLLEDIKKQKAFNFTLKGSLGVMGVVLVLSVFGIFGGN